MEPHAADRGAAVPTPLACGLSSAHPQVGRLVSPRCVTRRSVTQRERCITRCNPIPTLRMFCLADRVRVILVPGAPSVRPATVLSWSWTLSNYVVTYWIDSDDAR